AALFPRNLDQRGGQVVWTATGIFFAIIIGLRHEIGADWFTYLEHFSRTSAMPFMDAVGFKDPGYYALIWVVNALGGDIYDVNLISAVIFMGGLIIFARQQPLPWIALVVAVPYLLIVVAMGYSRQGVAIGFALAGLAALEKGRVRNFAIWVLLGAMFHKSAVLLLPIAALAASRNRFLTMGLVGLTSVLAAWLFVLESRDVLWEMYVVRGKESGGGLIRVMMNAVPATLLLLTYRRLELSQAERKLWLWMAVLALACIPLVLLSSTATDRVALYFIPLQIFVFSRIHRLAPTTRSRTGIVLAVIAYSALVQFVWLNFASHANAWVPYKFMPL
ncbi:MAG TPA: EpsG family protein, partial [Thioalkalivibrio sp.]|nr:EpsG family protein [Thioalkalivibrio sp.]